jgi:protoheme IX farnesyltransferase
MDAIAERHAAGGRGRSARQRGEARPAGRLATLAGLFKVRIGVVIAFTALAGVVVTPGAPIGGGRVAALVLAVLVAAMAAGAFNQWWERDLDVRMARTRHRPFVTGAYAHGARWLWLIGALGVAAGVVAALATNWLAAAYTLAGAFTYGVVYTVWLKRRTAWNIVVGGLAGSFAVLAGAAAVSPHELPAVPALLALALFLWTPPHFWSLAIVCRDDYAAAGVPMLPVVVGDRSCARWILVHTLALVTVSLVPLGYGMGWAYATGAVCGGAVFVVTSLRLARRPDKRTAIHNFLASLAQLTLLLAGAMVDVAIAGG